MTGRTLSHYEVLEKLGAGGMGEIYKARDPRLNRMVAIKALPASSTGDPDRRRRFIQEAQAASALNHPNIITIHDILSEENSDYMVMEFVAGKTLGDLIRKGGLGTAETLRYLVQIADALAAAHAAGIIHRDLKPGNVMVTASGLVKILDFGLAKVTPANALTEQTQTLATAPMTVEGSILGTVSYMSPEQAQGKKIDARSDIFAFGALAYEMITGEKAFPGDSAITTLTAILRDEVRPISDHVSGVPPELEEIIGRALRKDPDQRWQTMQEAHGVLAALRQKFESGILDATKVLPPAKRKGMSAWGWAGLAFGITFAIGGWWSALHRRVPRPVPSLPPAAVAQASPAPVADLPANAGDKPPGPPASPIPPPRRDDGLLTNDTIVELIRAKVAEPVILSQIHSSKTSFQLSASEVIRLTKAGASAAVLEAMRNPGVAAPAEPAAAGKPAPETKTVELVAGIPFEITLAANVPNDVQPGSPLRFKVKKDFAMGKDVVVAAGAPVQGEVTEIKKGLFGRGGKPMFRLLTVDAVDGSKVKIRAVPGANAEKLEAPVELPGRHEKGVLSSAGSTYLAYVDGPQAVQVKR